MTAMPTVTITDEHKSAGEALRDESLAKSAAADGREPAGAGTSPFAESQAAHSGAAAVAVPQVLIDIDAASSQPPDATLPPPPTLPPHRRLDDRWVGVCALPLSVPLLLVAFVLSPPYHLVALYARSLKTEHPCTLIFFDSWLNLLLWILAAVLNSAALAFGLATNVWQDILNQSLYADYMPLAYALEWLPWPQGRATKLHALAANRRGAALTRSARLRDDEDDATKTGRRHAIAALAETVVSAERLATIQRHHEAGADLGFPNANGESLLTFACHSCDLDAVEYLLANGANPNLQLFDSGHTALHVTLVGEFSEFKSVAEKTPILARMLGHEQTDPSLLDHNGRTPYMDAVITKTSWNPAHRTQLIDALRPSPTFDELITAATTGAAAADAEALCDALYALVAAKHRGSRSHLRLRAMDMLFCAAEGDEAALAARRVRFFEAVLRPLIARAAKEPKLSKEHRTLVVHLYEQSGGPPQAEGYARNGYAAQFKQAMDEANGSIECLYGNVSTPRLKPPTRRRLGRRSPCVRALVRGQELERLLSEADAASLFDLPKKESLLSEKDLNHGRFLAPPAFAFTRDLADAARELQRVGVLASADSFCDLIQQGRHPRLLPRPLPMVFKTSVHDDEFWCVRRDQSHTCRACPCTHSRRRA